MSSMIGQCVACLADGRVCPDCHRRQVLDDHGAVTRTIAAATMTPASLLAYARAELERCAAIPPAEDDEPPF
jgi:hypothetical protein